MHKDFTCALSHGVSSESPRKLQVHGEKGVINGARIFTLQLMKASARLQSQGLLHHFSCPQDFLCLTVLTQMRLWSWGKGGHQGTRESDEDFAFEVRCVPEDEEPTSLL